MNATQGQLAGYDAVVEQAVMLGRALEGIGWMVATAESCTGGMIASALTEIGGSSVWFERGFVTYSNEAKQQCLGVTRAVLDEHGAVSEETARQMARGALAASRAQIALSVTGIAGPGGAVPGKPVGTVCFGWAMDGRIESQTRLFSGDRAAVREQTALHSLRVALQLLASSGVTTGLA